MTQYRCEFNCCCRNFIPLEVAYARTIHKFQGLSAGPVDHGKAKNFYQCIICDPDEKMYEGKGAIGLLYTAVSRATTLGDDNGLNSAIYFDGPEFKEERFQRLTKMKNSNEDFKWAKRRALWVAFLNKRERMSKKRVQQTLRRSETVKAFFEKSFDCDFLHTRVQKYKRESFKYSSF